MSLFQWLVALSVCYSDEEESEEKKRITEERLKAYHEKKSKKAAVIAKTSVLLDVKVGCNFNLFPIVQTYMILVFAALG